MQQMGETKMTNPVMTDEFKKELHKLLMSQWQSGFDDGAKTSKEAAIQSILHSIGVERQALVSLVKQVTETHKGTPHEKVAESICYTITMAILAKGN